MGIRFKENMKDGGGDNIKVQTGTKFKEGE